MKRILTIILLIINCQLSIVNCKAQQGQWTWMNGSNLPNQPAVYGTQGVFAAGNTPPSLYEPCQWTDHQGNFWLFAGLNYYQDDLWKFDPLINQWAWMKGPGVAGQAGIYGTLQVPSVSNNPGGRGYGEVSWLDNNNILWLYGGDGFDVNNIAGPLGDLWKYDMTTNEWTWMNGSNTNSPAAVYGTQGVPDPANTPGGLTESNAAWVDGNNNLWMYGGDLPDGAAMSALWMFNTSTYKWTWVSGSSAENAPIVYGTKGVPNAANMPGGRFCYASWKSSNGDFWLFGGNGRDDMWRYNIASNEWTWMSGTDIVNSPGNAGTQCVPDTANFPSGRTENRACWTIGCDNFVNYGGTDLSDLWNFNASTLQWTWMNGTANTSSVPNWGTILVPSPTNAPGVRRGSIGWKDIAGNLWMFGGWGTYNDVWKFVVDTTCPHVSGSGPVVSAFTGTPVNGCNPLTVTFNNSSVNSSNFSWNFGDNSTSNSMNPTHTFTDSGTYTVRLIANGSCNLFADTSTMTITVNPSPAPVIIGDSVFCIGTISILNSGSFASYNWSNGSTSQTISVDSSNTYTVTVTSANGCTGTASKLITVYSNPTPTIGGGDSVCAGDSLMIYTDFYSHYLWNNGDTTSINNISTAGTYFVTVTDYHGCTAIDSITISVNPLPIPVITASGPTTFCQGDSVTLTISLFPNYHWSNAATTQAITVKTLGNYIVTVTTAFGCTATTSDSVNVIPLPNVTCSFHADTTKGCSPLTIQFINTSINSASYLWRFGDGDTSTAMNPIHTYTDSGSYSITLITTNTNPCGTVIDSVKLVDYIQVNVFHPLAAFTSNYATPIYTGDSIHFQGESYDLYGTITLWQWWFGDGTGTNFINPIHEWNLPGMYQVELIITDNKGCKDSTIYDYIDVIEGIIEIPNIFSPNNDGYNDFFEIKASGIATFQLDIFNRWGMKLFTSNSINIMWDGYNQNGLQCPDGTYYYVIKATGDSGTAYNRAGFVVLIR